ncbi:hypothetical protein ABIE44_003016 [Marmoricola sp. OAE513]|uniref:hypothetical protein n=1 Tax=Marmoricola sp. OAE513 TaxID=2817894 RepID=UPI001AE22E01
MTNAHDHQSGMAKVVSDATRRIEAVDVDLRRRFTGRPVLDIVGAAAAAFATVGVRLSPTEVRSYAQAVSCDKPFETS